jgi:type IV pilus assembly protein PilE
MKHGFSLIELLIVFAIIGIITMTAYPSYHDYIVRAHRSDGQAALVDLANRLEHYYTEHHTYKAADVLSTSQSSGGWYHVSITQANDTTYTLQATPVSTQQSDKSCQSLTLDHLGHKGITTGPGGSPTGTVNACW